MLLYECTKRGYTNSIAEQTMLSTFVALNFKSIKDMKKTIGTLIEMEVRKQMSITEFAEKICCQRNNVYDIFNRSKIDIILLKRISEVLNHNFFQDLANDLGLVDIEGEMAKDKAIAQFYKVVPNILREMGKDDTIISGSLPDEPDCPVPDFLLPNYIISFTIGETFDERFGQNPLLPVELMRNKKGTEVELLTNLVHRNRSLNIKLDYKTEEEWRETLAFAFELHEQFNIF